jgi:hypothetical protein
MQTKMATKKFLTTTVVNHQKGQPDNLKKIIASATNKVTKWLTVKVEEEETTPEVATTKVAVITTTQGTLT